MSEAGGLVDWPEPETRQRGGPETRQRGGPAGGGGSADGCRTVVQGGEAVQSPPPASKRACACVRVRVREQELKAGGREVEVTAGNRREYVELLVDWVLSGAVRRQFEPFKEGFLLMLDPDGLLRLLTPRELEARPPAGPRATGGRDGGARDGV